MKSRKNHNQVFVAMDDRIMAGYIAVGRNMGEPRAYDGEVCGFFIRRSYRRLGIGLRLLKASLGYLHSLGYRRVAIYNYRISQANSYYRMLGGRLVWLEIQHPGGMALVTEVLGWEIPDFLNTLEHKLEKYRGGVVSIGDPGRAGVQVLRASGGIEEVGP